MRFLFLFLFLSVPSYPAGFSPKSMVGNNLDIIFVKKKDCDDVYPNDKCLNIPDDYNENYHTKQGDNVVIDQSKKDAFDAAVALSEAEKSTDNEKLKTIKQKLKSNQVLTPEQETELKLFLIKSIEE